MGEIGGSSPPGTTDERTEGLPDWGRGPVGSRLSTHTALRVRLPLLPLGEVIYRGVLLGEQAASKTDAQGSNPCAPADCRRGSIQKGTDLVSRPMLVRNQSSALQTGLP